MLKLELGQNLNPDDIEEGDDVYFECKVHANPWAYKVVWKHNVSMSYLVIHTGRFIFLNRSNSKYDHNDNWLSCLVQIVPKDQFISLHFIVIVIIIVIISEFITSKIWLGNIQLSWDIVINNIRLGDLICYLKCFPQLNMCQELQIFAVVYTYLGAS